MKKKERIEALKIIKEIRQWTEEEMWCHHLDGSDLDLSGMIRRHPEKWTRRAEKNYMRISAGTIIDDEEHSALFDLMNNELRFKLIDLQKLIEK